MTNSATLTPPTPADAPRAGWRWAPHWVLAFVALWPAPGYAEAVMVLGALAAIVHLRDGRFRGGLRLLSLQAWALTSVLFCAYWLPQLVSASDAVDQGRARLGPVGTVVHAAGIGEVVAIVDDRPVAIEEYRGFQGHASRSCRNRPTAAIRSPASIRDFCIINAPVSVKPFSS